MKTLKAKIDSNEVLVRDRIFYITVSKPTMHSHPVWTNFLNQPLDKELREKIGEYVSQGITNIRTIKVLLTTYVQQNIANSISIDSRAYFPKKRTIYNYVMKFIYQTKQSQVDQVALERKINVWKNSIGGNFFFRPYCEEKSENFLFCYQNEWQRKLLMRYQTVVLLDATYKTTRYALPLFQIVVKTNVNYVVVGTFVVLHEDSKSIEEALEIFKEWNPDWKPSYFIVDYSEAEMKAIQTCFPTCMVYIIISAISIDFKHGNDG